MLINFILSRAAALKLSEALIWHFVLSGITSGFFFYSEFKIRLIRLDLSFKKEKYMYSNSQPTAQA